MANDTQSTPQTFFDALNAKYNFVMDVCADENNHKCPLWLGPGGLKPDALTTDWSEYANGQWVWMNPPYSRGNQRKFVEKAIWESRNGVKTLALLPADTGTKLFHELIYNKFDIEFVKGRLKFNGVKGSPKFASMLVEFKE
jgi:phage N-6-adenine-methyltransferase